jgi:hypothetical protein
MTSIKGIDTNRFESCKGVSVKDIDNSSVTVKDSGDTCSDRIFNVYNEKPDYTVADDDKTKIEKPYDKNKIIEHLKADLREKKVSVAEVESSDADTEGSAVTEDVAFWYDNPTVLVDSAAIKKGQLFPKSDLSLVENLNATVRLAFLITVITFYFYKSTLGIYLLIIALVGTMYMYTCKLSPNTKIGDLKTVSKIIKMKMEKPVKKVKEVIEVNDEEDIEEEPEPVQKEKFSSEEAPSGFKKMYESSLFKSVDSLLGNMQKDRNQTINLVQDSLLAQSPAELFYGKNLNRKQYI